MPEPDGRTGALIAVLRATRDDVGRPPFAAVDRALAEALAASAVPPSPPACGSPRRTAPATSRCSPR
jgi:hypothetical protein